MEAPLAEHLGGENVLADHMFRPYDGGGNLRRPGRRQLWGGNLDVGYADPESPIGFPILRRKEPPEDHAPLFDRLLRRCRLRAHFHRCANFGQE